MTTSSCIRLASPRNARSTSIRARRDVDRAHRVATSGTSRSPPSARADLEHLARRQREQPPHDADLALAVDDAAALEVLGPPLVLARAAARSARGDEQSLAAQRLGAPSRSVAARRGAGSARSSVPARRTISRSRAADAHASRRARAARARGRVTWKRAVEPVRAADAARVRATSAAHAATLSRRCRRARGGCPCTAAALTTVRSALAVRPPRPMTLP